MLAMSSFSLPPFPILLLLVQVSLLTLLPGTLAAIYIPLIVYTPFGSYQALEIGSQHHFLGIRYALAPVGDLRFAAPREVQKKKGWAEADIGSLMSRNESFLSIANRTVQHQVSESSLPQQQDAHSPHHQTAVNETDEVTVQRPWFHKWLPAVIATVPNIIDDMPWIWKRSRAGNRLLQLSEGTYSLRQLTQAALPPSRGSVPSTRWMKLLETLGVDGNNYNAPKFRVGPQGIAASKPPRFRNIKFPSPPGKLNTTISEVQRTQKGPVTVHTPSGVHYATKFGPVCPQPPGEPIVVGGKEWPENEDCLTLNIFRPASDEYEFGNQRMRKDQLLPVVVYIHGGAFTNGGAPEYDMRGFVDVASEKRLPLVAVTIQYRLGRLGFLQSVEVHEEGATNAGLLDQRLALKWVKENIKYFGGDPNKITLMGQSAGALSVGAHLLWSPTSPSYVSDKLFHQAISISGGPIWYFSTPTLATHVLDFHRLLQATACSNLQCLRYLPLPQLQTAFPHLSNQTATPIPLIDDSIYLDFPSKLLAAGAFKSVPIIFGDTTDEGTFITPSSINTDHDFETYIAWDHNADHRPHTLSRISKAYPNRPTDQLPKTYDLDTTKVGNQYKRLATYNTDRSWVMPRRAAARAFLKAGAPVWNYRFDVLPDGTEPSRGVYHGADVPFFLYQTDQLRNPKHEKVARDMAERFAAFVAGGDPNVKGRKPWPMYGGGHYSPHHRRPHDMQLMFTELHTKVELDRWRREQTELLESVAGELRV